MNEHDDETTELPTEQHTTELPTGQPTTELPTDRRAERPAAGPGAGGAGAYGRTAEDEELARSILGPAPAADPAGPPVWSAASVPPPVAEPSGVRTGTLVLGLVLALFGIGGIAVGLDYRVDLQLAAIVGLVAVALVLLAVPLFQRSGDDRAAPPR